MQFLRRLWLGAQALADPYFHGLSQPGREPSAQPVSKLSFDFERRKLTTDEARSAPASSSPAAPVSARNAALPKPLMMSSVFIALHNVPS